MINIIEDLKTHEKKLLDSWYNLDEHQSKKFLQKVVRFADENPNKIKQYCRNTLPLEFSSLSIIYEALSEYSNNWHEFLLDEIKRIIALAKAKRINYHYLSIIEEIDLETIYGQSPHIYSKIINHILSNLDLANVEKFNLQLLEALDWFFIELDVNDKIVEQNWIDQIVVLANNGRIKEKLKAREILENFDREISLEPFSTADKSKKFYKKKKKK